MTLERFRDLVFSPLDLPAPPQIDGKRLVAWMAWAREESRRRGHNRSERGYEGRTGRQYPWLMATIYCSDPGAAEESFEREFPQVLRYARQFPCRGIRLISLIAQRKDAAVHLHTDTDGYWGFRFYLANRSTDALYFCMARHGRDSLPRRADDSSPLIVADRRHYARWPKGNHAYCLNSVRAAHAVDAGACELGERIACLVMPQDGHDEQALLDLLEKSTAKFGDYQLWYR